MKYSLAMLGLAAAVYAAPTALVARGPGLPATVQVNDYDILQYALTLEHLEDKFYRDAIAKYSEADFVNAGFPSPFYKNLKEISYDETTHVSFLTTALKGLGQKPVAECKYNFPYTSPSGFVMLSSILEGVGVSAYLGAANRIASKAYVTAAGSILTVESRHSAYIRSALHESPFPAPFDVPLDFNPVYSLAAQFIVSCPASNGKLPFTAFPALAVAPQSVYKVGSPITFVSKKGQLDASKQVYAVFYIPGGPVFVKATNAGNYKYTVAAIPKGASGQTYAVLQYNGAKVDDSTIIVGPAVFEVCPPY